MSELIREKQGQIAIIGLGYVGLPLLMSFGLAGFDVIGIDINQNKIDKLNKGESYITDRSDKDIGDFNKIARVRYSTLYETCHSSDYIIVCVPTPLNENRAPDLTPLSTAIKSLIPHLKQGALIIIESTTYPGTTEEVIIPILACCGKEAGSDYFIAYSPERVDPGNAMYHLRNTPKIIGGFDLKSMEMAKFLYEQVVDRIVPVSSMRTAEIVKIVENAYRNINIAFVNELAIICRKLSIDVWEVLDAASTKPFGFTKFMPGPGVGGHCIPVDPMYLSWKLREANSSFRLIDIADQINTQMPEYIVRRVIDELNQRSMSVKGSKIILLGVAYKKDINDYRESPALRIIEEIEKLGANICYYDPLIPEIMVKDTPYASMYLTDSMVRDADCMILVADHTQFEYSRFVEHARLILDTKNALSKYDSSNIVKL